MKLSTTDISERHINEKKISTAKALRASGVLDRVFTQMFDIKAFNGNYLFYVCMIGQCNIKLEPNLPAPAGVSFQHSRYVLHINLEKFEKYTLLNQMAILKHEMEHILNNHVTLLKTEKYHALKWNLSTDCAINQLIDSNHLPDNAILPSTFPVDVPLDCTSEQYYDYLNNTEMQDEEQTCPMCNGTGETSLESSEGSGDSEESEGNSGDSEGSEGDSGDSEGSEGDSGDSEGSEGDSEESGETCKCCAGKGTTAKNEGTGDHSIWNTSEGSDDMRKAVTADMIKRSMQDTVNSRGTLPNGISDYMELFYENTQISWQNVLRNMQGNKKANTRRTFKRRDRRNKEALHIKGKSKNRTYELLVIVDVSGSMSSKEINVGLNEIHGICKMNNSEMKLIQIDTEVHGIETFDENTKLVERKGSGGTTMEPAIDYIHENKIHYDGIIFITDGYVEDVSEWKRQPKSRVIWLSTDSDIPGIDNLRNHEQFKLEIS